MKPSVLVSIFALSLSSAQAQQNSGDFEKRMYNIYKNSYSQEVSDDQWEGFLKSVGTRSYTVRGGDTLWGLSTVFFGDGNYWSKIWSYNAQLTNPHLITIGQNIRFFTGSVEQPPGVIIDSETGQVIAGEAAEKGKELPKGIPSNFQEVTGANDESSEKLAQSSDDTDAKYNKFRNRLYPGAPSIPPPRFQSRPVLNNFPTSFVDSTTYDASQYDDKGFSMDIRPPIRVNPLFVAHSFLYVGDVEKYPQVARVIESENDNAVVGLNQKVYFDSRENLKIGDLMTVMGVDYHFDRNNVVGDVIRYMGTVQVTNDMGDKRYQGEVVHSIAGIGANSWLSREVIPSMDDDFVGRPSELELQVIGGGADNNSRIYGQSDVVYLKGGANRGVRVGDIMGIYKRRDFRYLETKVSLSPEPIAHIKVFRAEPNVTSAFVLESREVIIPGDETGRPTLVEAVRTQSEKDDLNQLENDLDFNTETQKADSSSLEEELTEFE